MRAFVIVDLGFGDAGKGLLTDFLVRRFEAGLVVRYNGGAQAGHNVIAPDGRHHTFSQFGAGTFVPNVRTYLSRHVVIDPLALMVEGDALEAKGVPDVFSRLRISDQALVITPFQRAANRVREMARGADRHGSCGIGVGETVEDALASPEIRIVAGDLNRPALLRQKLDAVRDVKREQIIAFCKENSFDPTSVREFETFEIDELIDRWIAAIARIGEFGLIMPDSNLDGWMQDSNNIVFEGAQGVLLDADAGFHPYTTWSRSTTANAVELIEQVIPDADIFKIGVLRSYAVRHGPGPFPTETTNLTPIISEHNQRNDWQGTVRYGWFDAVLARYALNVTGGVDALAITHIDILPRLENWQYCSGYQGMHIAGTPPTNDTLTDLHLPASLSLAKRTQFTHALSKAAPNVNKANPDEETVIREIERLTGHQVAIVSHGPGAENVQVIDSRLS
ncbi:MAG: adenylosuccinate synthetase [Chloroflexota bacterium]